MRKPGLYAKLGAQSIAKNRKLYLPYILTCIACVAMFYILYFLRDNRGLNEMGGKWFVVEFLNLGAIIVALFCIAVLLYTNSFLIKRRRMELGLYGILGMEKRHIACVLLWETIYVGLLGVGLGLGAGILLSKLVLALMCAIVRFPIPFGFSVSASGVGATCALFSVIFLVNLLVNLRGVASSSGIEMLHAEHAAEKPPKSSWIAALIGLITLGVGYGIALRVDSAVTAILYFFVAVILVIIGTYCLFTAGSVKALSLMRANKRYYYQPRHFTTVSGMLYRMRRNAAGLATICILSTMVLVTISTTVCLYAGTEDAIDDAYPRDLTFMMKGANEQEIEAAVAEIHAEAAQSKVGVSALETRDSLTYLATLRDGALDPSDDYDALDAATSYAYFITDAEYRRATGASTVLNIGELLCQDDPTCAPLPDATTLSGIPFTIVERIQGLPPTSETAGYIAKMTRFVVREDDMQALCAALNAREDAAEYGVKAIVTRIDMDLDATAEAQMAFASAVNNRLHGLPYTGYRCRADGAREAYGLYGGFFFLGVFLGMMFLMATALIIYYKQVTEGYEDATRFQIMRKIGMSDGEVRASIRSQVLTVFFLPLIAAALHIAMAFPMITKMLELFRLQNTALFSVCCLSTLALFAAAYVVIYLLTAKAYYRIVKI